MLRITRREYKVMLEHRLFINRKSAARELNQELHAIAKRLKGVECDGQFSKTRKRDITFLDTRDLTIQLNGLLLRQRVNLNKAGTQYTLKCRSADRYLAAGADLRAGKRFEDDVKFEEDIGAPFVCRFSHSNTILGPDRTPRTLADAAKLFPALGKLERDGEACSGHLALRPVSLQRVYERVLTGPVLRFSKTKTKAEVALIIWSEGQRGRPLVAEFSFRYEGEKEKFPRPVAQRALEFFRELQRLDVCLPQGRTKTQWMYEPRS